MNKKKILPFWLLSVFTERSRSVVEAKGGGPPLAGSEGLTGDHVCRRSLPFLPQAEFIPLFKKPVLSGDQVEGSLKKTIKPCY